MKYAVVIGILHPDGHILGVSRKDDFTQFGVPGGKFDPEDGDWFSDQHKMQAVLRELREETGVILNTEDLTFLGIRKDGEYIAACYGYRGVVDFAQQPGEGLVKWVTWDELWSGPFGNYNRWLHDRMSDEKWV